MRTRTMIDYSLPVVAFGALFMLIIMYYMKYATDVLFMNAAAVGLIFGAVRFSDAIVDAFVGYLSDRTHSRFGRRRPWLVFSAPAIAIAFYMAFSPPAQLEGGALVLWVAVAILGFYVATTAFVVPHMALGAEMTLEEGARNRLFGVRWGALVIGYILGIGAMWLLIRAEEQGPAQARQMASMLSVAGGAGMVVALVYTFAVTRERPDFQARSATNALTAFGDVLRNRDARKLLFIAFVEFSGASLTGVMALYVTEYVIKDAAAGPLLFLIWLAASLAAMPLWVAVSKTVSKQTLWITALTISGLSYGSLIFVREGDVWFMVIAMVLTGGAAACGNTMGPALQCDLIDEDERRTGQRKEGTYFACWNFVVKAASGVTVLIAGLALTFSGFKPGVEQTSTTKLAMLSVLSLLPLVAYLSGAAVLRTVKVTRPKGQIEARPVDPVAPEMSSE